MSLVGQERFLFFGAGFDVKDLAADDRLPTKVSELDNPPGFFGKIAG